jgi:hypothetical protein
MKVETWRKKKSGLQVECEVRDELDQQAHCAVGLLSRSLSLLLTRCSRLKWQEGWMDGVDLHRQFASTQPVHASPDQNQSSFSLSLASAPCGNSEERG